MRLNKTLTEKENIVAQFREDIERLKVEGVSLPLEAESYTLTELQSIPGIIDDGSDVDIIPNTKVKIQVNDKVNTSQRHETLLNYKRLHLNLIKMKKGDIDGGKGYELKALPYDPSNLKILEDIELFKNQVTQELYRKIDLPLDSKLAIVKTPSSLKDNIIKGVEEFTVKAKEDSLILTGEGNFLVLTRDGEVGVIIHEGTPLYFDFSKGTTLKDQQPELVTVAPSLESSNKVYIPANTTTIPENFFTDLPEEVKDVVTFHIEETANPITTIEENAFKDTRVVFKNKDWLNEVEYIGEHALNKATFSNNGKGRISLNKETLSIAENALNPLLDFTGGEIASLDAYGEIIKQTNKISDLKYTKTYEEGKTQIDANNYNKYGKAVFTKNGTSSTYYFTKEDVTNHVISPPDSENNPVTQYLTAISLPTPPINDGEYRDLPNNFARASHLPLLPIDHLVGLKFRAGPTVLKDATIDRLVIENEASLAFFKEENSLQNVKVKRIDVSSEDLKNKLLMKAPTIISSSTTVVINGEEPSTSPTTPSEVTSIGFNYND